MNFPLINQHDIIDTINLDDIDFATAKTELNDIEKSAYAKFDKAVEELKIIRRKYPFSVSSSMGKDSTLMTLAALRAHMELIEEGAIPQDAKFHITTIDTLVENHLIKLLVKCEIYKLEQFGRKNNINMDIRVGKPNLSRQWASMYLSGLKFLSLAKVNNDCSQELKISSAYRIEKQLMQEYDGNICCLLGSRLDESTARKKSLESFGQDTRTADDLIMFADKGRQERIFAPICNITTEEVWLLLRRAGTHPLTKPSKGFDNIPSYAKNHALLSVIYADASDGSCPVSAKRIPGDKRVAGGCSASPRHGCSLCLKIEVDRSATEQSKSTRHGLINSNILRVRDYLHFIGSDMSKRSWHTRAIDQTTGAIAAQPNTLNAETLDYVINLLCSVTVDEIIRAKAFKAKVLRGDELLDEGYADIFTDNGMSDEEKSEFADAYKRYAIEPMISPINEKIALYLSVIHARDGIKLPPYRAVYLYKTLVDDFICDVESRRYDFDDHCIEKAYQQVKAEYERNGIRKPYPKVDGLERIESPVPDAVMLIPEYKFSDYYFVPHTGGLDLEQAEGCTVNSRFSEIKVPFKLAKRFLDNAELSDLGEQKNSDMVTLSGFVNSTPIVRYFLDKTRAKKIVQRSSKRPIRKVSRANKGYRVIERGRTSIDKPSFGARTGDVALTQSITNEVQSIYPSFSKIYEPNIVIDESAANAYEIDELALMAWIDYEGLDHAIKEHDTSVALRKKWDKSIYYYSSAQPFESLLRWGVLSISNKAKQNSMLILKRTAYFSSLGLFRLNDQEFSRFAQQSASNASFKMSDFTCTQSNVSIHINQLLNMNAYRALKVKPLLALRSQRNRRRKSLKNDLKAYEANPIEFCLSEIKYGLGNKAHEAIELFDDLIDVTHALENNSFHSAENKLAMKKSYLGFLRFVYSYTSDINSSFELMPKSVAKLIKNNPIYRMQLNNILESINHLLIDTLKEKVDAFIGNTTKYSDVSFNNVKAILEPFTIERKYKRYSIDDSPALIVTDIEW